MTGKSAAKAAAASVSGVKQKKKAKKQRCALASAQHIPDDSHMYILQGEFHVP